MSIICPTILAAEPHEFREQLERISKFAQRIHIDLADGVFAPSKLLSPKQLWWPEGMVVDLHVMYESVRPFAADLIKLKPHMVIVHAESVGSYYEIAQQFKAAGIKVGVALLAKTDVQTIKPALHEIDHVLVFSGDLGHFGGTANLQLLDKVQDLRALRNDLEIGWDGGINAKNAKQLVAAGVDVLNVGGAIHRAKDPAAAYATLKSISEGV